MDYRKTTLEYYAQWLDVEPNLFDCSGIFPVYSPKRDTQQAGYSTSFDLYAFIYKETVILSYGNRAGE